MTSRREISVGTAFTAVVPNSRELEVLIKGYSTLEFDQLSCKVTNTSQYPAPKMWPVDEANGVFKLRFDTPIPVNTGLSILIEGRVFQKIIEEKTLINKEAVAGLADGAVDMVTVGWWKFKKMLKQFGWMTVLAVVLLYGIKYITDDDKVTRAYQKISVTGIVDAVKEVDSDVLLNSHEIYANPLFLEVEKFFKEKTESKDDFKTLYNYTGGDLLITKNLIQDLQGRNMLTTRSRANSYCAVMGGRLLNPDEITQNLADIYFGFPNVTWPIKRQGNVPEWTNHKLSFWGDNYFLALKESEAPIELGAVEVYPGGFVSADDGDINAAFKCAVDIKAYVD